MLFIMPIYSVEQLSYKNPPDTQTHTSHAHTHTHTHPSPQRCQVHGIILSQVQHPALACISFYYVPLCTALQPLQVSLNGSKPVKLSCPTFNLSFLRCSFLVLLHVALSGRSKNILPPLSSCLVYRHSCGIRDCGDNLCT